MFDVSIIICCFNSESRIVPTLEYLSKQKLSGLQCELIIVDNNCNDSTVKIAHEYWKIFGSPFEISVVHQSLPGIANARKLGVEYAKGNIILFCDDDNWLDENYIVIGYRYMHKNPKIGALGGRSVPIFEGLEPFWFTTYQASYAVGVQSLISGDVTDRGYVWGAGLFLRRQELTNLYTSGFKNYCIGRKGNINLAGDDFEICCWLILIGKKLYYNDQLIFNHYIPNSRLTTEYYESLVRGFHESSKILKRYIDYIHFQNKSKWGKWIAVLKKLIKSILLRYPIRITLNYFVLLTLGNMTFDSKQFEIELNNLTNNYKNIQ